MRAPGLFLCAVGLLGACSAPAPQDAGFGVDASAPDAGHGTPDAGATPDGGLDAGPVLPPSLTCLWPTGALAGTDPTQVAIYGTGYLPSATARWNGAARPTVFIDAGLVVVTLGAADLAQAGQAALDVVNGSSAPDASLPFPVTQPAARRRILRTGLYTQIERRGYPVEYWSGQLLQDWSTFDSVTNDTPAQEAQLQLDAMRAMGVNAITFELRAADGGGGPFVPPTCPMPWPLGLQYPQPLPVELSDLGAFLDLAQAEGMKVWLRLPNTHMEEQPPANNAVWLSAALAAVKGHPALDAILFDGAPLVQNGECGLPAEPPLWNGRASDAGQYIQWAIAYALDAGFPARQLSAEEIVGSYILLHASNLQDPVVAMRDIFDALNIPPAERTYALSFYEADPCATANGLACTSQRPDLWAQQTLNHVWDVIGRCTGARVIAPEMGALPPLDGGWRGEWALENLGALFEQGGVEGGSYWVWANFQNSDDADTTRSPPVKWRGTAFNYSVVQKEIADWGGQHLSAIPNGSFERGDAGADLWVTASADGGTVLRYWLPSETGQPEVLTRGDWALRLSSGTDPNGAASAHGAPLPVIPDAGYEVTGSLRFAFSGDPNPAGPPALRPQVRVSLLYFAADGGACARPRDDQRLFQENSASDFATWPLTFVTPDDAAFAVVELGVERHGLPAPLTADFDNLR